MVQLVHQYKFVVVMRQATADRQQADKKLSSEKQLNNAQCMQEGIIPSLPCSPREPCDRGRDYTAAHGGPLSVSCCDVAGNERDYSA